MRIVTLACLVAGAGCMTEAPEFTSEQDPIINGDPLDPNGSGEVLIFSNGLGCSGTLLTNAWVLTAAHCGLNIDQPGQISVSMGTQSSVGAYAVNHPSLDFGLVRLATPFAMNGSTTGFRTPLYGGTTASLDNQTLWCKGYGCNAYPDPNNLEACTGFATLRQAMLTVKPGAWDDFNFTIGINGSGQVLAPGDSGSGCFANTGQGWALAGVTKSGSTTENFLGRPENWVPWATAYVNDSPVPLPSHWFTYQLPDTDFLKQPLSNNESESYTWNPCPGGHNYTYIPTYSLETNADTISISSGGGSVTLTGAGTVSQTGSGPITVAISTSGQNQSTGLIAMPIMCSDLGATPTFWYALAGGPLHGLTAGANPDGTLEAFALDAGGQLMHSFPMVAGAVTTSFTPLSSQGLQQIAVGRNADGRLEVFAVGADGALYTIWKHADGSWSGWLNLGRNDARQVAVTNDSAGTMHAFVLTSTGAVFRTSQVGPNGGWSNVWASHGGSGVLQIFAAQNADGRPELFGVGSDHALYQFWQWGNGTWASWSGLGRSDVLQVVAARDASGTLAAYIRSSDGSVYRTAQSGPNGGWPDTWTPLWGSQLSDISVDVTPGGLVQVFSVGGDARAYITQQGSPNGAFQSWRTLDGGGFVHLAPAVSSFEGRLFGLEAGGMVSQTELY